MRRPSAIVGTAVFLVVAPGVGAGLVPWWITHWRFGSPLLNLVVSRFLGVALIALGTALVVDCFARFALQGLGTPVPVLPTEHLVITGAYRYVRNPIYVAVIAIMFGEALLLGSRSLLLYGCLLWFGFHAFVCFYEEPTLRRTYGEQYESFCRNVPRWIPRLRRAPSSFTAKQAEVHSPQRHRNTEIP